MELLSSILAIFPWLKAIICTATSGPLAPMWCSTTNDTAVGGPDGIYKFACPAAEGSALTFNLTASTPLAAVTLSVFGPGLCTLSLENGDGPSIAIARSYDGYNWERAGGKYITGSTQLRDYWWVSEWDCQTNECSNFLPTENIYVLRNRAVHQTETLEDGKARFLEAASFGATRDTIASLSPENDFASSYIHSQMYDVPPTFHRAYFRQHANPIWNFHHSNFAAQDLNPCLAQQTTWRRYIFSEKDWQTPIQITSVAGTNSVEVRVKGQLRGILDNLRFENLNVTGQIIRDGSTCFCEDPTYIRRGKFHVENRDKKCFPLLSDDLKIDFLDSHQPPLVLQGALDGLSNSDAWHSMSNFLPSYLYKRSIPLEYCSHLPSKLDHTSPPVFSKTAAGEWLIYEPRIRVNENSLERPIPDGGQHDLNIGMTRSCSNAPRTFLNEASCKLGSGCRVGSIKASETPSLTMLCGSPGEVGNDLTKGDSWLDMKSLIQGDGAELGDLSVDTTPLPILARQREYIWSQIVMIAGEDQLRQRVAWALSQIFALPIQSISVRFKQTEIFLQYYDIFVRNAFGNYFDVLREIAYSPLNAESLTYLSSKSVGYVYSWKGTKEYPDENFARELMQLFTIGLLKLNMDGTPVLFEGKTVGTYTNEHVMSFAKAWTGFLPQPQRANVEVNEKRNAIDPMSIDPKLRDRFPKINLERGYIGDGYPLCADMPERSFLRIGAKYRLLGTSPRPEVSVGEPAFASPGTKQLFLNPSSALYKILCAQNNGMCTYPILVVLEENLPCDGIECQLDKVQVLNIGGLFYEYVRVPCVEQSFYQHPQRIANWNQEFEPMCASPNLPTAASACCDIGDENGMASPACLYVGERMSFSTAKLRCVSIGQQLCYFRTVNATSECPHNSKFWTTQPCYLQVKVNSVGDIAIVHRLDNKVNSTAFLQESTPSFFKAFWEFSAFPTPEDDCALGLCEVSDGSFCLCNVTVEESAFYQSLPPTAAVIMEELTIGHLPPNDIGSFQSKDGPDYIYYTSDGSCCDSETVFEVTDHNGIKRFLKNLNSTVVLNRSMFRFRNPVQFNSLQPEEYSILDAGYETDAVLKHLLYHQNTPPFVAYRYIQRFGVSNPSPRYIYSVAQAFRNGLFFDGNKKFGMGTYGDLAATVAAVLLDREARSFSLTFDPIHGSLREPILKVIGFMRAMEYNSITPLVELDKMEQKIGQMAHEHKTVFSFFRPDFSVEVAAENQLVSPEAQVQSSGYVVELLNGLFALISDGLKSCDFGFASYTACLEEADGKISLTPSDAANVDEIIAKLSTLLTCGRLSADKQARIAAAIAADAGGADISDTGSASRLAMNLILTSPEFHATNRETSQTAKSSADSPGNPAYNVAQAEYKAVIHLFLDGGADSFNLLTPHTSCPILWEQYLSARGSIALQPSDIVEITGNTTGQPCASFGLHASLQFLKQLYDEQDLVFVSNVGVLTEPVTIDNYLEKVVTQIFAHNAMAEEVARLDPINSAPATGSLGRLADVVQSKGYRTGRTIVEATTVNLVSKSSAPPSIVSLDDNGVHPLRLDSPSLDLNIELLNGGLSTPQSGIFGEVWSQILRQSRNQTDSLYTLLLNSTTVSSFSQSPISSHLSLLR
jgi:uncharacterized protein (DUF1800 family)